MPPPFNAVSNPYGTYTVEPTVTGLRFQVSVRDPRNSIILAALIAKSLVLALLTYSSLLAFAAALILLLILDVLFYLAIARTRLYWIEVRPDGLTITPDITDETTQQFFDRRGITRRELDYQNGLTFRYGIHDIQATPAFCNEREYEIFDVQFEQAIARLWHQSNLNT